MIDPASHKSLSCPVCRAVNDAGPACRRCKADLTLCSAVEARRSQAIADAARELTAGNPLAALVHARQAHALRPGADIWRLQALAHLLRRDFVRAWWLYQSAKS